MSGPHLIASVRERLRNKSVETGELFDFVLSRYAVERLLYRLSVSDLAEQFVLKGALLFHLWNQNLRRPTRKATLTRAAHNTFDRRKTPFPTDRPNCLSPSFAASKETMWQAFLNRNGIKKKEPFADVVAEISARLPFDWAHVP